MVGPAGVEPARDSRFKRDAYASSAMAPKLEEGTGIEPACV